MRAGRVLPYALALLATGVLAAAFGAGDGPRSTEVTSTGDAERPATSTSSTTEVTKVTIEVAPPATSDDPVPAPAPGEVVAERPGPVDVGGAAPPEGPVPLGPAGPEAPPEPAPGDPVQVVMRGRVTSPSGQPVGGLCVIVMPAPMGGPVPEGVTGDDGRYEVVYRGPDRGPNPRSWNIGVRECSERTPGYRSEWVGNAYNVPVGGTATVDGVVARPASVRGTVTGPDGRPLEGYCLFWREHSSGGLLRTGSDGTYVIPAADASTEIRGAPGCREGSSAPLTVLTTTPADGGQVTLDVTVPRPPGDDMARPAARDDRYWHPTTMTADRGPDEPVPSCAPDALGGVWLSHADSRRAQFVMSGYGVLAAYAVEDGALVEIACWRVNSDLNEQYEVANLRPATLLQFAGTAPDSFAHVD